MKNKILKRVLSVLLCVCVSCCSFSVTAFASNGGFVTEKPTIESLPTSQRASLNYYKDLFNKLVETIDSNLRQKEKLISINRLYYFSLMVDNSLNCSSSVSSGSSFSDEYLWFYFNFYLSRSDWTDGNSAGFFSIANEDGIITDVNDVQFHLKNICFIPDNWSGRFIAWDLSDPPSYFKSFKDYYNYLYSVYISDSSLSSDQFSNVSKPVISSGDFKDLLAEGNDKYIPKNTAGKMSFRTDDFFHGTILKNDTKSTQYNYWFLYTPGQGFKAIGGGDDIYLQFFFTYGGNTYYSQYQYHFTMNTEDVWFSDRDEVEYTKYQLAYQYWDFMYSDENSMQSGTMFTDKDCEFFRFQFAADQPYIGGFSDYSKFSTYTYSPAFSYYIPGLNTTKSTPFYASDRTTSINFGDGIRSHFKGSIASHDNGCSNDCDIGYIASSTPIKSTYDIDVSRIPNNYYVTISGDTVYDYSITNPETGQTSTINEYVTNNYTFVTNNNGNEGGSGVGGNVTVGGHIDVTGSVGVDINVSVPDINININGNGGGGSADSIIYPDTDLVDNLPETPQGFLDYLKILFDFLPPGVLALLIGGIAAAIFCRIWGR